MSSAHEALRPIFSTNSSTLHRHDESLKNYSMYIVKNNSGKLKKKKEAHFMRHKSTCHCIYFMPGTLECLIYYILTPHGHCRGPSIPSISGFLLMLQYCDTE